MRVTEATRPNLDAAGRARHRAQHPGSFGRRARRQLRRIRHAWKAGVLVSLLGIFRVLLMPIPLRPLLAMAAAVGRVIGPLTGSSWHQAGANLALAFPERSPDERRRIARESFANLARSAVEIIKFRAVRRRFDSYIVVRGLHHLRTALLHDRGVLAITGHVGNWELLAAYCAWRGLPCDVVGRQMRSPMLDRMLVGFRARNGVTTISRESVGSARAILRTLRANRILALLIDQDTQGPGVFVPFFGRPARTPSGAAVLARRRAMPVIPIFISRRPSGGHLIEAHPPIEAGPEATVEDLTARYTAAIEAQIRQRPDEWVWWHRRWRHQPSEGNP